MNRSRPVREPCGRSWLRSLRKQSQRAEPTRAGTPAGCPSEACSVADNQKSRHRPRSAMASALAAGLCPGWSTVQSANRYLGGTRWLLHWLAVQDVRVTKEPRSHAVRVACFDRWRREPSGLVAEPDILATMRIARSSPVVRHWPGRSRSGLCIVDIAETSAASSTSAAWSECFGEAHDGQ